MAVLLVKGVMNLGAMVLVTAAITAERVLPDAIRATRIVAAVVIAAAVIMIYRALTGM
jgi:predicted metal-binding membrane protein